MGQQTLRRRRAGFAAGLASLVMALGFTTLPADAAPPSRIDYVALGDSYTAGTGANDNAPGFEFNPPCDQTPGGYVDALGKTGRVNLVVNAACHGALLTQNSSIPHLPFIPSLEQQIAALIASDSLNEDTELVSITAGANDVGVTGVLVTCLTQLPQACLLQIQEARSRFPELYTRLLTTYQAIEAVAPEATIVVGGYPKLFDPTKPFGQVDPAVLSAINLAVDELNGIIGLATESSGTNAVFADVTNRFVGHEVNSEDPWVFFAAPTLSSEGIVFDPRNFHPTAQGHRAYASALLASVKLGQLVRP